MRNRPRIVSALSLALAAALLGANKPPIAPGVSINITVTSLRSNDGLVRACLTPNPKKFPSCNGPGSMELVVPAAETVTLSFPNVAPGRYAIAVLHDENSNGKADRALMMMPKEGFGFSRDAKVFMGPPSFKDAAFDVGQVPVRQVIKMRYML